MPTYHYILLIFLMACNAKTEQKSTIEEKEQTSKAIIPQEEAVAEIADEQVKNLFNGVIVAEDFIRGDINLPQFEKEEMPYITLRSELDTRQKLEKYVGQYYSKEATKTYINRLDVTGNPENNKLGRAGLYFYTPYYAINKQAEMTVSLLQNKGNIRLYKMTVPMAILEGMNPDENRMAEANNFEIIYEDGAWKVNKMFEELHDFEKK